jgi:hypothetical protein
MSKTVFCTFLPTDNVQEWVPAKPLAEAVTCRMVLVLKCVIHKLYKNGPQNTRCHTELVKP